MLRGIGGEQVFLDRYRRESQTTRRPGSQVARLQSVLDALQVLPARRLRGDRRLARRARSRSQGAISAGELVAFYGYAAFLMIPLRTATEYANKLIRGRVAARRVCRVLALDPELADPADARAVPAVGLRPGRRRARGLRVRPGVLTAIVAEQPDDSARARRPARPDGSRPDDDVRLGRRAPHRAAPRRGAPPDPGLRHRRHAVLRPPRATGSTSAAAARRRPRALAHGLRRGRPRRARRRARRARSPSAAGRSPAASGSGWCWPGRC